MVTPYSPPGGSKTPWTAAPELSEAVSARWPGQYSACAKEVIFLIEAMPHGQRCGPVRAYGRLAPSFPGRRIQEGLRTTATKIPSGILPCFRHLKPPERATAGMAGLADAGTPPSGHSPDHPSFLGAGKFFSHPLRL